MASLRSVGYGATEGMNMKSVILLRGINVGEHGKRPMKDLCRMLEGLGAVNLRSYIQSGNVVVEGAMVPGALAEAIEDAKGFGLSVMVFSKADSLRAETERLHIAKRAIWLHAPSGVGRSKLAARIEALAGVACTARNMNRVRKLREMLDG